MTKHEARKQIQELSDKIELYENMIENNSISYESKKILSVELNGLYALAISLSLNEQF